MDRWHQDMTPKNMSKMADFLAGGSDVASHFAVLTPWDRSVCSGHVADAKPRVDQNIVGDIAEARGTFLFMQTIERLFWPFFHFLAKTAILDPELVPAKKNDSRSYCSKSLENIGLE